ncbi:hypothetical protein STEG23_028981, partial [Scotinomys teguina]
LGDRSTIEETAVPARGPEFGSSEHMQTSGGSDRPPLMQSGRQGISRINWLETLAIR